MVPRAARTALRRSGLDRVRQRGIGASAGVTLPRRRATKGHMDSQTGDSGAPTPGEVEEFAELFRATFDRVTRFVARRLRDPADVADIVAGTYAAAFAAWRHVHLVKDSPIAWVYGITRNLISLEFRHRRYSDAAAARSFAQELMAPDEFARVEEVIDALRLAPDLERLLDATLTANERDLLRLVHQEDLAIAEAGRVLGISPVAARMRLARARRRVRKAAEADHLVLSANDDSFRSETPTRRPVENPSA